MIKLGFGALVLALSLSTPLGGQEVEKEPIVKGKLNNEYHYDGYLITINKFLFGVDVKYVRFYEEQDNKVNVLEITYPNGVFEKYWDSNDDLIYPEDVERVKGKRIMLVDCKINWRYYYPESEYYGEKQRRYYKLVNKINDTFSKTLKEILKRKK